MSLYISRYGNGDVGVSEENGGRDVALVRDRGDDASTIQTARLFAAAPEILEMLERLAERIDRGSRLRIEAARVISKAKYG